MGRRKHNLRRKASNRMIGLHCTKQTYTERRGFSRTVTKQTRNRQIFSPPWCRPAYPLAVAPSIQRLNEEGAARDSPLHHAKTSEAGGTKTTLSYLWRRLAASGIDVGALWAGICSVIVKSLVCVEGSIPNQPNRYECAISYFELTHAWQVCDR